MPQRRMQSKSLSILSCVAMLMTLLLLPACSSLGDLLSGGNTKTSNRDPATIHVGFVSETSDQNFAVEMAAGAQYAANQYHVSAQIVAPPNIDDQAAVKMFQNLMQSARDGIAVETLAPNLFVQPEAAAVSQKIPVIAVDTTPLPGANVTTYIGNDNVAAGAMLANAAINLLSPNVRGSVIVGVDTPGVPPLEARTLGIKQQFSRLRPDIQVLGPFNSFQDARQNFQAWTNLLNKSIVSNAAPIVAGLGVGDPDNASLAQIKQNSHGTYLTGAFDLNDAGLQAVANGTNFALVDPEHFLKGYVAMRLLIEHALYGTTIPQGWWNTGAQLITQSNVQDIIARQVSLDAKGRFYQPIIDQEFANSAALIKPIDQAL